MNQIQSNIKENSKPQMVGIELKDRCLFGTLAGIHPMYGDYVGKQCATIQINKMCIYHCMYEDLIFIKVEN